MKFWSPLFRAWWAPGSVTTAPATTPPVWVTPPLTFAAWVEPLTVVPPQLTK